MRIILSLLLILGSLQIPAQSPTEQIDSLKRLLRNLPPDTHKVKLLDAIAYTYSKINPDSGLHYAERAIKIAVETGWEKGEASALAVTGINYAAKSSHDKALEYYTRALAIYRRLDNKRSVAAILSNLSNLFRSQGDYAKALEYGLDALTVNEATEDLHSRAMIQLNIGNIYLERKEYKKAMAYYSEASAIYEQLDDMGGMAMMFGNLGIVQQKTGNLDKALFYHSEALERNSEMGLTHSMQRNLANIGLVYSLKKEYGKSLEHHLQALELSRQSGDNEGRAINLGNIGETYYFIARDDAGASFNHHLIPKEEVQIVRTAINYLTKSLKILDSLRFPAPAVEFAKNLSEAYALIGDYRQALHAFKIYVERNDSINSLRSRSEIASIESRRALDIKDREIILKNQQLEINRLQAANKRNERIIFICCILLLLLIMAYAFTRHRRKIKANQALFADITYLQSHKVRGPVARILGLSALFNYDNPADPENPVILSYIRESTMELDEIVRRVVSKTAGEKSRIT